MGYLFALFINSGIIKSLFEEYLPIDLTVVSFLLVLVILLGRILVSKAQVRNVFSGRIALVALTFGIFAICILCSALYTSSPHYWMEKLLRVMIFTLPSFLIPFVFFKFNDIRQFIIGSFVIYSLIVVTLITLLYKFGSTLFYMTAETGLPHYLIWGSVMSYNSLLFIGILQETQGRRRKNILNNNWIIFAFGSCVLFILFVSGARGPFISFMICFFSMLFIKLNWRLLIPLVLLGAFLHTTYFYLQDLSSAGYTIGRSDRLLRLSLESTSVKRRIILLEESMKYISERPLLGYGIGSFSYLVEGEDKREYPHNLMLEVWFENGLIATVMFVVFLFSIAYIAVKRASKPLAKTFIWVNFYFVLHLTKSSSLTDARVFFAFLGMLLVVALTSTSAYGLKSLSSLLRTKSHVNTRCPEWTRYWRPHP